MAIKSWKNEVATEEESSHELVRLSQDGSSKAHSVLLVGTEQKGLISDARNNDELYGGRGDDVTLGRKGNDSLSGNQRNDLLIGGAGADTFCFDGNFDREAVVDFSACSGDRLKFIF